MKRYMMMAAVCGCLLIGSLYPRLFLEHHIKLMDEYGEEIALEEGQMEDIPIRLELRFLKFFR